MFNRMLASGVGVILAALPRTAGLAQTPAEFYRGKTIEIQNSSSVGGGYDIYARMIARHISKRMPGNPQVVPKNMEGAAGMRLANWLYSAAPRDGTVIGATSRAMAFEPLLGNKAAQYDARRVNWIGSANDEVSVCTAWHTSGITSFAAVQARCCWSVPMALQMTPINSLPSSTICSERSSRSSLVIRAATN